ncbi:hypothetical protein BDZ91DRAFT_768947 [Kalaharituber pfeilii]|nr:hypothetical protein BDZ91DRAFT_768947 [Kalaharituber pfeilii]
MTNETCMPSRIQMQDFTSRHVSVHTSYRTFLLSSGDTYTCSSFSPRYSVSLRHTNSWYWCPKFWYWYIGANHIPCSDSVHNQPEIRMWDCSRLRPRILPDLGTQPSEISDVTRFPYSFAQVRSCKGLARGPSGCKNPFYTDHSNCRACAKLYAGSEYTAGTLGAVGRRTGMAAEIAANGGHTNGVAVIHRIPLSAPPSVPVFMLVYKYPSGSKKGLKLLLRSICAQSKDMYRPIEASNFSSSHTLRGYLSCRHLSSINKLFWGGTKFYDFACPRDNGIGSRRVEGTRLAESYKGLRSEEEETVENTLHAGLQSYNIARRVLALIPRLGSG